MRKIINQYRVYGRTKGRKKISIRKINIIDKYKIHSSNDIKNNSKIIIDIGSGYGESSIYLAKKNSDALIIAAERFLDGNINLSKKIFNLKIKNIKIFEGNIIQFLDSIEIKKYFSEIWILFPDPWPKNRHHKRRLINENFLLNLHLFLKKNAIVYISTDSKSYLVSIMEIIYKIRKKFVWENYTPDKWSYELDDLPLTKFYFKAKKSKTTPFFIKLRKI